MHAVAGCADGQIVIWDIETRGVAQRCTSHRYEIGWSRLQYIVSLIHSALLSRSGCPCCSMPVTSVAWSKDGRTLLSGSLDKTVSLWDLQLNTQVWSSGTHQQPLHRRSTLCLLHLYTRSTQATTAALHAPVKAIACICMWPKLS